MKNWRKWLGTTFYSWLQGNINWRADFIQNYYLWERILRFCDKKYRILMFCDKKYRILTFRNKKYRISTFRDKKNHILTFCDKKVPYFNILWQKISLSPSPFPPIFSLFLHFLGTPCPRANNLCYPGTHSTNGTCGTHGTPLLVVLVYSFTCGTPVLGVLLYSWYSW